MLFLVSTIVFTLPLFFLPILPDPVFGAKSFFLAAAVLLVLLVAGIRLLRAKRLTYTWTPLDFLVLLFFLANLVSWFFLSPGAKVRSLVQPMGFGTIASLTLFYFIIAQLRGVKKETSFFKSLIVSVLCASIVSIVLFLLPESFFPWRFINNPSWSPVGSSFILLQLLIPLTIIIFISITREVSQSKELRRWWLIPLGVLILVGCAVNVYQSVNSKPAILDWFSSWAIAVEAFKRHPLFGVGPGNFNVAFNLYRPPEFNRTEHWALRFVASRSWFLQVWTELGLVGLVVLLLLLLRSWRLIRVKKDDLAWLTILFWLVLLLLPGNIVTLFVLFLLLALIRGQGKEKNFSLILGENGKDAASAVFGGILVIVVLVLGYFVCRGFWAEHLFYRALEAASQNRGADSYNLQLSSIKVNRFMARSRVAFAQTNLALANGLAQKGKDLTDDERRQISQLMNQAVAEAKAAVALEPRNVVDWENLAWIYRQLINVAQGADQWALVTYQQAIAFDAINPRLRVDYGGLLYGLGKYEEAAQQFEIAVNLKSDYANAWYNWAWALKQQDKLEDAIQRLQQAVNLVEPNTPDHEKASKELEEWKEELGKETTAETKTEEQQPQELTQPQPMPSPKLEEPIKLPEEAAPPLEATPSGE